MINAPPHSEARLCFEPGIECEELILTTGACHDWNLNLGSHGHKPSALPLAIWFLASRAGPVYLGPVIIKEYYNSVKSLRLS